MRFTLFAGSTAPIEHKTYLLYPVMHVLQFLDLHQSINQSFISSPNVPRGPVDCTMLLFTDTIEYRIYPIGSMKSNKQTRSRAASVFRTHSDWQNQPPWSWCHLTCIHIVNIYLSFHVFKVCLQNYVWSPYMTRISCDMGKHKSILWVMVI